MRRYLILLVILAVILLTALVSLPALAKPESFELGSYKVSYDIINTSEHNISIAKPRYSETFSGIMYVGYGAQVTSAEAHFLITIAIIEYKYPILLEPSTGATNKLLSANIDCRNVVTVRRNIDGHQGYLTNSSDCRNGTHGFVAQFLLDGGRFGKNRMPHRLNLSLGERHIQPAENHPYGETARPVKIIVNAWAWKPLHCRCPSTGRRQRASKFAGVLLLFSLCGLSTFQSTLRLPLNALVSESSAGISPGTRRTPGIGMRIRAFQRACRLRLCRS